VRSDRHEVSRPQESSLKTPEIVNGNGQAKAKGLSRGRVEMVEATGRLFQMFGLPRSTGQIYGLLYLSSRPLSLDDIVEMLSISKGSASTGVRHLASWCAIRQVWVPGERRDFFEALDDFRTILRGGYSEFLKPRISASDKRLESIMAEFEAGQREGSVSREEYQFCISRLKSLGRLQKRLQRFGPLAEKFLH
jgi:DNA-binding transcriptional regulator GbsR (MarR family)